jgi:hypothetical protein
MIRDTAPVTSSGYSKYMAHEIRAVIDWKALWIFFSAWCVLSGWGLSLFGLLNAVGICISFLFIVVSLILLRGPLGLLEGNRLRPLGRLIRSRGVFPKVWLVLAAISLLGGLLYAPSNYDYLTYRFPRLLNWCWEQKWHWINTVDGRMNFSGTNFEWMMAPFFILFKTDRLFFLINFIPYLFLPGLIFSVFTQLGISRRISWWWMWVLPCGYCFILQAPSAGNDSFGAFYFLASLHYLLRARNVFSAKNLILSCLAIGLLTGAKASNLPLALPWLVVLFFNWRHLWQRSMPAMLALALILSALVSFVPTAALNHVHTGDFFGDPTNAHDMKVTNPVGGIVGNFLQLSSDNLAPPLWPTMINWRPFVPAFLNPMLDQNFPRLNLIVEEMQIEETAGVGLGIVLCVLLFLAVGVQARVVGRTPVALRNTQGVWVVGCVLIALLVYMAKIGNESASRLIAAYYPLLVASVLVLVSLDGSVIRERLFRWAGLLAMLSALPLVILSPARPLIPVGMIARAMESDHGASPLWQRFNDVYSVYGQRPRAFEEVAALLPADQHAIGFLQNGNEGEASLWRPYGSRELVEVTPMNSRDEIKALGLSTIVVSGDALQYEYKTTISDLAAKWSAQVTGQKMITLRLHEGQETWYVLSL